MQQRPLGETRRGRQPGWYVPWIFVGMFLVVFAANGIMIMLAFDTFPGLATEHAYEEGIAYNQAIAGAQAQAQRGWQVEAAFTPDARATGTGLFAVAAAYHDGTPITSATVTAEFRRPTIAGHDVAVVLEPNGTGGYAAPVRLPMPGLWDVHVRVAADGTDHQMVQRISVSE